jgi:hypothetical protein
LKNNLAIWAIVHPTTESGVGWYRWAVHLGDSDPRNLHRCANAGLAETYDDALRMVDRCAATAHVAMRIVFGVDSRIEFLRLDEEPQGIGTEIRVAACGDADDQTRSDGEK